jgi:hypothetical protein
MVSYTPQFSPQPWIDFVDTVQAGGSNGFNARFQGIVAEFNTLKQVVSQLNAGLGAFQPVGAGGAVAYTGGNVGVGANYSAANLPAHALEVSLGPNTGPPQQACFGNAVCCNGGPGAFAGYAVFSHSSNASDSNYALSQGPNGDTKVNAAAGRSVSICQNGNSVRMGISADGNVIVGGAADLFGAPAGALLQVAGDAYKAAGGQSWAPSDARIKKDVHDLEAGLTQLRKVRPVRFRYNGLAGTPAGREDVGVLGQEIEKIFPEMIRLTSCRVDGEPHIEDFRIYDGSALTYVLINAVKEVAEKLEQLEQALAEVRKTCEAATTTCGTGSSS